ncbi:flagellar biosynthetic protein FliO [Collimonas arenae]|uniref:Flagellar protein n=1 Tax=Collimonas arenae TaxID=279058 RepID=A0A127PM46_9BURK|nr:flagellar biosynthetic protein FliO [Collimonas arenae]AMO98845.1 flagellar biosynthetic protein FliO [Collimonas arenae]AMP08742.1 flagellar biosynthetic protein FliO [Collimonas arenae]
MKTIRSLCLAWFALTYPALPALAIDAGPQTVAATAAVSPAPGWGAAGLLQAVLGLALVIGLIFLCAWAARRLGLQKASSGQLIKIVASTAIGQRERVVVVDIGGTWLALGVTPGQIQSLHAMPAQELPATAEPQFKQTAVAVGNAAGAFAQKLRESLGRK